MHLLLILIGTCHNYLKWFLRSLWLKWVKALIKEINHLERKTIV